jgi:hypothetical protein
MLIGSLVFVLLAVVLVLVIAYVAKYVVDQFFPAPLHMPVLLLVGVILLLVLVWALSNHFGVLLYPAR